MRKEHLIESLKDVIHTLENTNLNIVNVNFRNNPVDERVKVPGPSVSKPYIYVTRTTSHEIEINIKLEDK